VKVGDLVLVTFGPARLDRDDSIIGIFMGITAGLPARADVFWDGEMISTPLDQIEEHPDVQNNLNKLEAGASNMMNQAKRGKHA
jgi:hypothetical protein